jgi:hypothetical protein
VYDLATCPKCSGVVAVPEEFYLRPIGCPGCNHVYIPANVEQPPTAPVPQAKTGPAVQVAAADIATSRPAMAGPIATIPPEAISAAGGVTRRRFPLWFLAVIIPGALVLLTGFVVSIVLLANGKSWQRISAVKLYVDYSYADADKKYTGKALEVYGSVENTGVDLAGNWYVELLGMQLGYPIVRCHFRRGAASDVAELHPAQKVSIRGTCTGKGQQWGIVIFVDCELASKD